MFRFLIAVFVTLMVPSHVIASEDKLTMVENLFKVSQFQKASAIYMQEYAKVFVKEWKSTLLVMDARTEERLVSEFAGALDADYLGLTPKLKRLYVDTFSEEELHLMLSFYASPTGQSIARKLDTIDQETAKLFYPDSLDTARKRWYETIEKMRGQGYKL
jgi:hypothetical protein